jgi:uroporphyrinogen decarboxylase
VWVINGQGAKMNKKFQNALKRIAQPCPPIWFMRQAGRYHSHYQNLRKAHSFIDLCKKPELAAEVAMGPIMDFDFDIAILFSDLLFPLEVMGMGLDYVPGPKLDWSLSSLDDVKKLKTGPQCLAGLAFQKEACELTRKRLPDSKSLIGFVGGPWTLFSYATVGHHETSGVKKHLPLFEPFCEKLMPLLIENIGLQLAGGAEAVMVLDTSAGDLSPQDFQFYVVPLLKQLSEAFPDKLGYYSKNTNWEHLESVLVDTDFAGVGVDHRWNLQNVLLEAHGFVQGNFDQQLLFLPTDDYKKALEKWVEPFTLMTPEQRAGWICGLGHGILPQTPEEHVRYFVKYVREVFDRD